MRRALLAASLLLACAALFTGAASATNGQVLILDTSVWGGMVPDPLSVPGGGSDGGTVPTVSLEQEQAELQGKAVHVAHPAEWRGMTTEQFAQYDAIVLGDGGCLTTAPVDALANAATWGAAVTGNVIVVGTDPAWNYFKGLSGAMNPYALQVTSSSIAFAAGVAGKTGLYVSLSCYGPADSASLLAPFGTFVVTRAPCTNDGRLVAPLDNLLTDANLGLWWDCSAHEALDSFPAAFAPLAVIGDATPYILTRGEAAAVDAVAPTITLTTPPDGATYARGSVVNADYSCDDTGGSGIATCVGDVPSGDAIDTSTLGAHSFAVDATDHAGNVATPVTHAYTVVDETDPTITLTTPSAGAVYALNQVVTASYTCADEVGGAGLATCVGTVANGGSVDTSSPGPHSFTVEATDSAGNHASVTNDYTVVADTTAPAVTLTTPPNGATYVQNQIVKASYSCSDTGGSGLASCVGDVANGASVATATLGPHTFTVVATDNANNVTTATSGYTVVAAPTPACSVTGVGVLSSWMIFAIDSRSVTFSDLRRHWFRGSVSSVTCSGRTGTVSGTGSDNGGPRVPFVVTVVDNGYRGDTFAISWPGYTASGTVVYGGVVVRLDRPAGG